MIYFLWIIWTWVLKDPGQVAVIFLLGICLGFGICWILFYRRYRKVRRTRYLSKLRNLQETARLEKEGY